MCVTILIHRYKCDRVQEAKAIKSVGSIVECLLLFLSFSIPNIYWLICSLFHFGLVLPIPRYLLFRIEFRFGVRIFVVSLCYVRVAMITGNW